MKTGTWDCHKSWKLGQISKKEIKGKACESGGGVYI